MKYYLDQAGVTSLARHLTDAQKSIFATKAEVGTPLVAATAADMTDETKIYVYVGSETGYTSGNWYYYDGSAWQSGGIYNSTAFESDTTLTVPGAAADAKVTGDCVRELDAILAMQDNIPFAWSVAYADSGINYESGDIVSSQSGNRVTDYINVSKYKYVSYKRLTHQYSSSLASAAFYDGAHSYVGGVKPVERHSSRTYVDHTATIPDGAVYARFTLLPDSYGEFSANGTSKLLAAIGTPSALTMVNLTEGAGDEVRGINPDTGAEEEQR